MGYDAKARVDINVEGVDGPGKDVLSWLAAWLRMPMGGKEKESPGPKEGTEEEKLKKVKETFGFHF